MIEKTFTWNDAKVTIRRGTVRSRLRASALYAKFGVSEDMDTTQWLEIEHFVTFLTRADVEGDLGFVLPSEGDDEKTLHAGKETFMGVDQDFYDAYIQALNAVDVTLNGNGLGPDAEKKD